MRTLYFLLRKEFLQIFRNKLILRMIFALPVIQLIILPNAATYEVKNITLTVVDHDHSEYSRKLIDKFTSSGYFKLASYSETYNQALDQVEKDKADLIVEIPNSFERDLIRENETKIFFAANAISGQTAGLAVAYANSIVKDFNSDVRSEWISPPRFNAIPIIEITSANWFNPQMNYKKFIVPGVLALLVTLVGFLMSSLNIVKEKEIGTIEQLNVSPIKKYQFILSKLIPFWLLGLMVMSIGFLVGFLIYGIYPEGSFWVGYLFAGIYLIALLGFGLLTSLMAETQQQAMFISYFFMLVFILLGGLFSPIENMPDWAQYLTYINPVSYFIDTMRMLVLKGSSLWDLRYNFLVIIGFAIAFNSLAIWKYKKTV